jgi:hypothetical protein
METGKKKLFTQCHMYEARKEKRDLRGEKRGDH